MKQQKNALKAFASTYKRELIIGSATAIGVMTNPVFAADGDWDMSEGTGQIAKGLAAALLLGLAMIGLASAIGALRQTRGAGR